MSATESVNLKPHDLRRFKPLDRLTEEQLILLHSKVRFREYRSGQLIAEQGSKDGLDLFLVSGEVELKSRDGRTSLIDSGSEQACNPIARLQPRMYGVTATTPTMIMQVEQDSLNQMVRQAPVQGEDESANVFENDGDDETPAHDLLMEFYSDLRANRLQLPSVPDVAFKVRRVTEREDASVEDMAQVIMADPSIAAKLVRACNSVLYRGFSDVRTVRDAVVRLGTRTTRQLVVMFAMREIFRARHKHLVATMDKLWEHSREVAALCWVLADAVTGIDPEEAMLAGLIHDIGMIPVVLFVDQHPRLQGDLLEVQDVASELRSDVGAAILEDWQFSPAMVSAARHAEDWDYSDPSPDPQLVDVVIVAQLHALIHQDQPDRELPHFSEIPAYRRLGEMELSASRSLELLHQAEDRVKELQEVLAGA